MFLSLESSNKEKDEIYKKWKSLVNMSATELESFMNSDEGKVAGLSQKEARDQKISRGRDSAKAIIRMIKKGKDKWNENDWKWAEKQISFISRMSGMPGKLIDDKGKKTRKYLALLIWGNDPLKK